MDMNVKQSEMVEKICSFLDEDNHVSLNIIRMQIGIGMKIVYIIIRGELNMLLICEKFLQ